MKTEIVFNHNAEKFIDSIGVDKNFSEKLVELIKKVAESETSKQSQAAELIHNELEYNEILLLATEEFMRATKQAMVASLAQMLMGGAPDDEE